MPSQMVNKQTFQSLTIEIRKTLAYTVPNDPLCCYDTLSFPPSPTPLCHEHELTYLQPNGGKSIINILYHHREKNYTIETNSIANFKELELKISMRTKD